MTKSFPVHIICVMCEKWGYENNIPLHKARTCVKKFDIECGDCPTCWDRRRAYTEAGVTDQTVYKFEMSATCPTYYDHEEEKLIITI